ncbi:MAG: hypothetical protein HY831_00170 [Candidatus Aenigmarchaeota archaeon]|nr:hypothetical protein [Candidatus Aenigmarchaeota archaeon]
MFEKFKTSFQIVFEDKKYIAIAAFSAIVMAFVYLFASQTITFFPDGIFFEVNYIRLATLFVLSGLFGIVISMQAYFIRLSLFRAKEAGTTAAGLLTGMLAMTCCAPILPSILVLFGFSGAFLLSTTAFFGKYLIYFSLISISLLLFSIYILSRNLTALCKVNAKNKVRK